MAVLRWSMETLAYHAGVSRMTVSRYLNGGPADSAPKLMAAFNEHGVTFEQKDGKQMVVWDAK
jgi:DNA-binding LacI/PurR family transcriptional regulator